MSIDKLYANGIAIKQFLKLQKKSLIKCKINYFNIYLLLIKTNKE